MSKRRSQDEQELESILQSNKGEGRNGYGTDASIDAENYRHCLHLINQEPTPLAKVARLKQFPLKMREKRALHDATVGSVTVTKERLTCAELMHHCQVAHTHTTSRFELWRRSLKAVEGMYGNGVASFFIFLRTILFLNIFLFLMLFGFLILPQGIIASSPTAETKMLSGISNSSQAIVACSQHYNQNVTLLIEAEGLMNQVQDLLAGTGWMERTVLFYGFYFPVASQINNVDYNIPLAYILTIGAFFFASLILVLIHTGRSFQESRAEEKERIFERYGRLLFASWDFSLISGTTSSLKQRIIYNDIVSELTDEDHARRHASMTTLQRWGLYTVRVIVNLVIIGMLAGAAWLIYFVQQKSTEYTASGQAKVAPTLVRLIMEFLPSITISAVGACYPVIFKMIVKPEDYKTETMVLITLLRTVFVKLFAIVVLVVTLYYLITCKTRNECNVGVGNCKSITCWETYVGQQFYKLLVLSFFISIGVCLFYETPRALIVKKIQCTLIQKIGKADFDTSKSVLEIIYIQIIVWFGSLFCPFLPGLAMITLFVMFYLKLFSCYYNYQPSEQPYKASRSRFFFLVVLACSYVLCTVPIGYCIVDLAVSKSCGPFRNHHTMYGVIPYVINRWPVWAQHLFKWMGSAAFLFLGLMILIVLIYYHATMAATRKQLNKRLLEQIELGTHDRKFLYRQLVEAGIEPKLSDRLGRKKGKTKSKNGDQQPLLPKEQ